MTPGTLQHNVVDLTEITSDDELGEMTDVLKESAIKAERAASRLEIQLTLTASSSRDQTKSRPVPIPTTSSAYGRGLVTSCSDEDSSPVEKYVQSAAKRRNTRRYDAGPQFARRLSPSNQLLGHNKQQLPKISTTILDSGIGESLSESDASRGKEMTRSSDTSEGGVSFRDATRRVVKEMRTPSRARRSLQWRKSEFHIPRKDSSPSPIASIYPGMRTDNVRQFLKRLPKKELVASVTAKKSKSKTYDTKSSKRGLPNQYPPIGFDGSVGDISLLDAGQGGVVGLKNQELSSSESTDSLLGASISQHQIEDPFDSPTSLWTGFPSKPISQQSRSHREADIEPAVLPRLYQNVAANANTQSFGSHASVVKDVFSYSSAHEGTSSTSSSGGKWNTRTMFQTRSESSVEREPRSPSIFMTGDVQLPGYSEEDSDSDVGVSVAVHDGQDTGNVSARKLDTERESSMGALDGALSTGRPTIALGASYKRSPSYTPVQDPLSPLSSSSFAELAISGPRSQFLLTSLARESERRDRLQSPSNSSTTENERNEQNWNDLKVTSNAPSHPSRLMQYTHTFTGHTFTNNDTPTISRRANETQVRPRLDSTDSGGSTIPSDTNDLEPAATVPQRSGIGLSKMPPITRRGSSRNQQASSSDYPGSSTALTHTTALFTELAHYMTKEPRKDFEEEIRTGRPEDHKLLGVEPQSKNLAKAKTFLDDEVSMSDFTWVKAINVADPMYKPLRTEELLLKRRMKGTSGHKQLLIDFDQAASDKWVSTMEWKGASSDILYCAWAQDGQKYALGAAAETDSHSMQYNRNNNLLLGDSSANTLRELPDHRTPRPPANFSEDPWLYQSITGVKFSSFQDRMYSSSFDETVKIWDVSSEGPRCIETLDHGARVDLLATSAIYDGVIATGSQKLNGSLRVYHGFGCDSVGEDANAQYVSYSSERALSKQAWQLYPSCLLWSPTQYSANLLLAGYTQYGMLDDSSSPASHGHLCVWNVETETPITLRPSSQNVMAAAWSSDGRYCATGTAAGGNLTHPKTTRSVVRVYDPLRGSSRMIVEFESPALDMNELIFHPTNENIVSAGCTDGRIYVWDNRNPNFALHILEHGEPIATLAEELDREQEDTGVQLTLWDKLGTQFYTGSSDGAIKRWDIRRSSEDALIEDIWTLEAGVMCGEFSPDEKRLLLGDSSGKAYILQHDLAYARYGPTSFVNPNNGLVKECTEKKTRANIGGRESSKAKSASRSRTRTTSLAKDLAVSKKQLSPRFDVPAEKEQLYIHSDFANGEYVDTTTKPKPKPVKFIYAESSAEEAVLDTGGRAEAQILVGSGQITLHPILGPVQGPKYKGPYAAWARPSNTDPARTSLLPRIRSTQLSRKERARARRYGGVATKMQQKLVKENLDIATNRNISIDHWPNAEELEHSDWVDVEENDDNGFRVECETCTKIHPSGNLIYCHGPETHFFCHQCIKDKAAFEMKQGDYRLECTWCDSTFDRSQKKAALDRDTFNTLMMKNGRPWGNKHKRNDIGISPQQEKLARRAWEKAKKEEAEKEGGVEVKVSEIVQEEMWKGWKTWRYQKARALGKKVKREEKYLENVFWWLHWET